MTVARLTKRRNKLEKQATEVIADLMGTSIPATAIKYGVAKQSMYDFVTRHQEEIEEYRTKATAAAEDWEIASKHYRIGEIQSLYAAAKAEIALAEDVYGKVAAIKTASDRLKQAAEELGQLPKTDITLNVQNNVVNLSWGEPIEPPVVIEQLPSADDHP